MAYHSDEYSLHWTLWGGRYFWPHDESWWEIDEDGTLWRNAGLSQHLSPEGRAWSTVRG